MNTVTAGGFDLAKKEKRFQEPKKEKRFQEQFQEPFSECSHLSWWDREA